MKKITYSDVFLDKKYKLIVLDMDGTLYYQRSMQLLMCLEMGVYGILHPFSLWKLKVVAVFRKIRETAEYNSIYGMAGNTKEESCLKTRKSLLEWQYELMAEKAGKRVVEIQSIIEEWMFIRPLKYLPYIRDDKLCKWIKYWRSHDTKVVVFSDYPAADKMNALDIAADAVYSSDEVRIGEMKPSIKGIEVICEDFNVMKNQILIVGDRMSKDGEMAKNAGTDYIIMEKWKMVRRLHY